MPRMSILTILLTMFASHKRLSLLKKSVPDRSRAQYRSKHLQTKAKTPQKRGFKPLNGLRKWHEGVFQHAGLFLIQQINAGYSPSCLVGEFYELLL